MKARFEALLREYGKIALVTYISIFAVVIASFFVAITAGFEVEGVASGMGTLGAAWLATKVTQPVRILATLILTPVLARIARRFRSGSEAQRAP